jgi:hypothetical protein
MKLLAESVCPEAFVDGQRFDEILHAKAAKFSHRSWG